MALSPEAIDAMLAAGVTVEQMAAIVKAELVAAATKEASNDEARRAKAREGNRERQARWRERRNADNANNAVTVRDERYPSPKDNNQTPTQNDSPTDPDGSVAPKGARTPRTPRKRALPTDWQPGERSERVRSELGRSTAWMHRTAVAMRTWAESKGEIRADWDATHDGWMRREADREGEQPPPRPGARASPPAGRSSPGSRLLDRMETRRARNPDHDRRHDQGRQHDLGPVLDHEGDGGPHRQVHEPAGGQARRFSPEAALRVVGAGRR